MGGFKVHKMVVTSFCKIDMIYVTVINIIFIVIFVMIIVFIVNIINAAITFGYWSMIF